MRKLSLVVCSALVLLGMFGLQAQVASADPEPDCAGKTADVQGFHFGTVSKVGGADSLVYGGAALCGSNIDFLGNVTKGYKSGYVVTPGDMDAKNGVTMHCANPADSANTAYRQTQGWCQGSDLANKSYTGSAGTDFIYCLVANSGCLWNESMSNTYVNDAGTAKAANPNCKPADKTVVQCLQATDPVTKLGVTNITVQPCSAIPAAQCQTAKQGVANLDPYKDRFLMKIYQVDPLIGGNIYLTEIGEPSYNHTSEPSPRDFQVCKYAGDPGATSCGTNSANWVQRNPPAGTYGCTATKPEGQSLRAVAWGGLVPNDKCVPGTWTP